MNYWLLAAIALLAALWTLVPSGADEACGVYGEMRDVWEQTDGEYGWPNHNQWKEENCRDRTTIRAGRAGSLSM